MHALHAKLLDGCRVAADHDGVRDEQSECEDQEEARAVRVCDVQRVVLVNAAFGRRYNKCNGEDSQSHDGDVLAVQFVVGTDGRCACV